MSNPLFNAGGVPMQPQPGLPNGMPGMPQGMPQQPAQMTPEQQQALEKLKALLTQAAMQPKSADKTVLVMLKELDVNHKVKVIDGVKSLVIPFNELIAAEYKHMSGFDLNEVEQEGDMPNIKSNTPQEVHDVANEKRTFGGVDHE